MNKFFIILLSLIFSCTTAFSQDLSILEKGENVINQAAIKSLKMTKDIGSVQTYENNGEIIYKATTLKKPEGVYNLSVKIPLLNKAVKAEQPMLICFKAKSIQASLETNESKVNWLFRQTESASPKDVVSKSVSLGQNWQTYYIPFKAIFDGNLEDVNFSMQFGYPPQIFEIKDIKVYLFPSTINLKDLPYTKITYPGMEETAQWRIDAEKRIEETRKGNFTLFFYHNGKPVNNKEVQIKQLSHHFKFGTAISSNEINDNLNYFETVKKLFNIVVFENDLKAKVWKNVKKRESTINAVKKLNDNNISVKGHVLLWPGFNYLPEVYKENKDNPKLIKKLTDEHVTSVLEATKGEISHWDVLNEVYTNKDIQNILGSDEILFETFQKAKELDPNAKRYINEYGIISGGGINNKKQDWYYDFVKEIDAKTNGAIDGIGMQSHIGTDLTSPTKVIEIIDRFSNLNKEISISEFTLDITDDEEIRAKYTRDFMIAAFSCKSVKQFLFWGFYEPMHKKAALVDENYKLTPMGQSYYDLVFNKWMSKNTKLTNENGMYVDRGFYGVYEFSLKHEGKVFKGTFEITPDTTNKLKINLQ